MYEAVSRWICEAEGVVLDGVENDELGAEVLGWGGVGVIAGDFDPGVDGFAYVADRLFPGLAVADAAGKTGHFGDPAATLTIGMDQNLTPWNEVSTARSQWRDRKVSGVVGRR